MTHLAHQDDEFRRGPLLEDAFEDGTVVFSYSSGTLSRLADTAESVWRLFDMPTTPLKVASALAEHYQVPLASVLPDVCALAGELVTKGLLVVTQSDEGDGIPHDA